MSRLCRKKADTGDSEFYRLAGGVYRGETTITRATASIRQRTHKHFKLEEVLDEAQGLFDDDGDGFYGWVGLRYFLFEYELFLKEKAKATAEKIDWRDFSETRRDGASVEHIYPQTPKQGEWPDFECLSAEQRRRLRGSLGNLLALSVRKNSSLRNYSFSEKRQPTSGAAGYFNGSYSEIDVAKEIKWTPSQIEERGLRMLAFMERRWEFSFGSPDTRRGFLQLSQNAQRRPLTLDEI